MVVGHPRRPFRWPAPRARLTPASSRGRRPLENRRPPVRRPCYTRSTPHMVTNVIWFIAVTLEVTILFRAASRLESGVGHWTSAIELGHLDNCRSRERLTICAGDRPFSPAIGVRVLRLIA